MKTFHCGLVVGKFAPLHKGHQLVIDTARAQCEHVVIVSYSSPELDFANPERRERWLADLYPDCTRLVVTAERLTQWFKDSPQAPRMPPNDAGDDEHREFVAVLVHHLVPRDIDAVFTSESYGAGFADHLSKRLAQSGAARRVTHIAVDPARLHVPVSGSMLREDLWERWQHLPAEVSQSLVGRVAILGGESSGKSTLALAMGRELETQSVGEYGRELWMQRQGTLQFDDYVAIAREQIKRENEAITTARRWVFCDTSPLTTLFYCLEQFGRAATELESAARRAYEHVVLCAPDFPFVQDGTRQDATFRERQNRWYEAQLTARGIDYDVVTGSLAHRVESLALRLKRRR